MPAIPRWGSIVKGASFDNNIICADEKVLIVVDSVADELMRLMEGQHAVKLTAAQAEQLQPVLLKNIDERGKGTVSRDWVNAPAVCGNARQPSVCRY